MKPSAVLAALIAAIVAVGLTAADVPAAVTGSTSINYGPLSHSGMKKVGDAPGNAPVLLQIGLVANQSGISNAAKAASDPTSATYGQYLTLSELASKYGASKSRQNDVLNELKSVGITGTVNVTALLVTASTTISKLEKLFATQWTTYKTGESGADEYEAFPNATPKTPKGFSGNVATVVDVTPYVAASYVHTTSSSSSSSGSRAARAIAGATDGPYAGGTPTRTGAIGPSCLQQDYPSVARSEAGLAPNQILTAYGISTLQSQGLLGQGVRVAILGEGPTPTGDVTAFRNCFGFQGTALTIHGGSGVQPILESSLDAMVLSMVAPKLDRLDLWVKDLNDSADDGDIEGFLQLLNEPLQGTLQGTPLPNVISISYGVCEEKVKPFTAQRTLVNQTLAAEAALGISVVVAAGDSGSSACARGIPTSQLTSAEEQPYVSWPGSSPWVLSVGGTNLTLTATNTISSTGSWNDTAYPSPYKEAAGGGGGQSIISSQPWWQPPQSFAKAGYRLVPDVAAFADPSPGYMIVCSSGVQGCNTKSSGQTIAFVGGTSASTPLTAGMIALWTQLAEQQHLPTLGFVPPLLYSLASSDPGAYLDVTLGTNKIFDTSLSCCASKTGYDLTTGLGSPLAAHIASDLTTVGALGQPQPDERR